MRQVVGRATRDLDAAAFDRLRDGYAALILDVGTGDGKHVLNLAQERPDALVVGLDAARDSMIKNSTPKRAPENAIFVWASVEQLPAELTGVTDVHVLMPWGSLLRAVVAPDVAVLARIAAACAPQARFMITINLHAWRPPVPEVGDTTEPTPESATTALKSAGWHVDDARYGAPATTSWAKRLGRAALALRGTIN